MQELKDDNLYMIGVHEMSGVGKTTLVEEVAWKAEHDDCYVVVIKATVSNSAYLKGIQGQEEDVRKIQDQLADCLGLKFSELSLQGRERHCVSNTVVKLRTLIMNQIMQELKDDNLYMIGVHEMSGVGKTTLVEEVAWKAEHDDCYVVVIKATVSNSAYLKGIQGQEEDVRKIQDQLADCLGLKFSELSLQGRERHCVSNTVVKLRTLIMNQIMQELKDDNLYMIGVHEMSGVGKTTLVEEVAWKAEHDDCYVVVIKATVSNSAYLKGIQGQEEDVRKIQDQLADCLGLKFSELSLQGRERHCVVRS
ncbi:hypothetical protein Lal_00023617 [Lupinus albus]|nr:hypothetical protein Lal_00023617 [Lupinus albus]